MQIAPLLNALPPIPSHAFAAVAALGIGIFQLVRRKGTSSHKIVGWMFVVILAYVAVSGLFIHEIRIVGPFSHIHILSFVTLGALAIGIVSARKHRISAHKRVMMLVFFLALVVTGLFTLLPGRIMYEVLFT